MTAYETLAVDQPVEAVLRIALNRPNVANALNTRMGEELTTLFEGLAMEPGRQRCVVLTGAGERAFCGGADLKERNGMTDDTWHAQHLVFERMIRAIVGCPVPIVAAVNGAAFAGGLEIALGCDFIYAANTARFALTEVTLGIMPGAGGTQNLPRALGERRAKELILTGRPFSAAEAHAWGLVNRLCAPEALAAEALETATAIAANAPLSVRAAKRSIHHGLGMTLAEGMLFEIEAYNQLVGSADRHEGIRSFNEKRKPRFTGR